LLRCTGVTAADGAGVDVTRYSNADRHIGNEAKTTRSYLRVPGEQVGGGEVVESGDYGSTILARVDNIVCITYAG
jgi:hypothetical protein